jgi:hypothetical protein
VSAAPLMAEPRKPSPEQRRRAIVTGVVLAALAVAIYATVVLEFLLR